jgi:hypothetical protein
MSFLKESSRRNWIGAARSLVRLRCGLSVLPSSLGYAMAARLPSSK